MLFFVRDIRLNTLLFALLPAGLPYIKSGIPTPVEISHRISALYKAGFFDCNNSCKSPFGKSILHGGSQPAVRFRSAPFDYAGNG